jgi:type II secretory pathway pseudopilin PulG
VPSGFTRTELLIAAVIVAVMATLAVPGLRRSRMSGNEAAAIGALRAITAAQTSYAAGCGLHRYATSLTTLGAPVPGGSQPLLGSELASAAPDVRGYRIALSPERGAVAGANDCQGRPTTTGYYASAEPFAFGSSGMRAFAVNTAGMVWQARAAAAPAEPFSAPSTPIQ